MGIMVPISIELHSKKGTQIVHKCKRCNHLQKNIVATDDNIDKIAEILHLKAFK